MQLHKTTGVILMLISALVFSTAGPFTKGVEAGAWEVIFWRGVFAMLFTVLYIIWRGSLGSDLFNMGRWGLIVAFIGASGTAAFIPAFKLTDIANVALIYAAAPMFAACFAWGWFQERLSRAVLIGSILAFLGVGLIVGGSLKSFNVAGDLLAIWMTIAMSLVMVIYRRYPQIPGAGPAALSSLILLPIAFLFGDPFGVSQTDFFITACFGLIFAIASVALVEGAKSLPSGEAGLLSALESPFAIVLAFLLFSEIPAILTLIGGFLILAGVFSSQLPNIAGGQNED